VGDAAATCWPYEFEQTELELDQAIAQVEGLLTDIQADALEVLDVRQAT
jgi:hypothetical protein